MHIAGNAGDMSALSCALCHEHVHKSAWVLHIAMWISRRKGAGFAVNMQISRARMRLICERASGVRWLGASACRERAYVQKASAAIECMRRGVSNCAVKGNQRERTAVRK